MQAQLQAPTIEDARFGQQTVIDVEAAGPEDDCTCRCLCLTKEERATNHSTTSTVEFGAKPGA